MGDQHGFRSWRALLQGQGNEIYEDVIGLLLEDVRNRFAFSYNAVEAAQIIGKAKVRPQ